ncbi:MAG: hypothetical protein IKF09_00455 [Clostridiales bacterium]|nr:hypothetical protein [Clostridiales bacterium]
MKRKVTPEEREILLNNPELVMFEPYKAMKTHRASIGKALILPAVTAVLFFGFGFLFPDFINDHPTFFAATGCIMLVISAGFLPILYYILDDRAYKQARATHYGKYLKMLLPEELECNTAVVKYVVYEKAEGGWIVDGKEEFFGYCGMVNTFRFEPQTEAAIVFDGKGFCAYVKRDPRTESLFEDASSV